MKFTYNGHRILLKDLTQEVSHCPPTNELKIRGLLKRQTITHCLWFQFKQIVEHSVVEGILAVQDETMS